MILNNPQRRLPEEQRKIFEKNDWEIIDAAQPAYNTPPPLTWLRMNVLLFDPYTAYVEKSEVDQAEQMDKLEIVVVPVDL